MVNKDRFGFLNCKWTIEFKGGIVSPIPEFDEVAAQVHKYTNQNGFLYPPMEQRMVLDLRTQEPIEEVPKTERPALPHPVPASHELSLSTPGTTEELRKGSGAFVIHLLAYLFGTRLQFHDWQFDGRVSIQSTHKITFTKATAEDFLSHCYQTWQGWAEKEQKLLTNVLYMHSRAPSCEWDWERFMIEYMVLDGCWRLAKLWPGDKDKVKHADRICILCKEFKIPFEDQLVKKIVKLRNDLLHETLWDGSQPGTTVSEDAFQQPDNLRRLNQRIIPALLGYKTPYVKTGWCSFSTCRFDQPLRR
jgi:hypothetical protein